MLKSLRFAPSGQECFQASPAEPGSEALQRERSGGTMLPANPLHITVLGTVAASNPKVHDLGEHHPDRKVIALPLINFADASASHPAESPLVTWTENRTHLSEGHAFPDAPGVR